MHKLKRKQYKMKQYTMLVPSVWLRLMLRTVSYNTEYSGAKMRSRSIWSLGYMFEEWTVWCSHSELNQWAVKCLRITDEMNCASAKENKLSYVCVRSNSRAYILSATSAGAVLVNPWRWCPWPPRHCLGRVCTQHRVIGCSITSNPKIMRIIVLHTTIPTESA